MAHRPTRVRTWHAVLAACVALLVAAACALAHAPTGARADMPSTGSSPVIDSVPSEFQLRVEQTAAAYNEAVAAREELEAQIAACEARIAELEAELPGAQDRAADAIYTQYRYGQNSNGLLELLLSAEDYNQFLATVTYLDNVTQATSNALQELVMLVEQVEAEHANLEAARAAAVEQEAIAQQAMAQAIAARQEAQRRAAEAAAARAAAEAAARAQAEADAAAGESGATDDAGTTETPGEEGVQDGTVEEPGAADGTAGEGEDPSDQTPPEASDPQPVDPAPVEPEPAPPVEPEPDVVWTERDAFIAEWGARIDSFLGRYGSPIYGYGSVFAAAAWDYGVDPRFSPAISFVESTCGKYCFLPHNAWGWGSVSWGSWEEAIYAHVGGLSRGYGYTVTYEGALKYCPPNADYWYWKVLEMMGTI